MNEKEFDYGIVVYKHRFNMTRSLDDYKETTLNKCIRIGLELKYKTMACDKLIYEMQIVYKDENNKLQCLCLDLHDWTIAIKHMDAVARTAERRVIQMSDDRPTDSEIVNCLNNTIGKEHIGIYCTDKNGNFTTVVKLTDLVDLINRIMADSELKTMDIESLTNERKALEEMVAEQKAEIERLRADADMAEGYGDALVARAKSEAIKAYKERIKQELIAKGLYLVVVKNVLEEAEKEMVGDSDVG